ncbi:hypothetical protein E1H13_14220 [Nodosilinea sp. P-1105]|nr:hypothetical protein [Nodosilinea sp. P-1105]
MGSAFPLPRFRHRGDGGEVGRWGDREMGRWGDGEMGRWGGEEGGNFEFCKSLGQAECQALAS